MYTYYYTYTYICIYYYTYTYIYTYYNTYTYIYTRIYTYTLITHFVTITICLLTINRYFPPICVFFLYTQLTDAIHDEGPQTRVETLKGKQICVF